jgi:hypothetical protein
LLRTRLAGTRVLFAGLAAAVAAGGAAAAAPMPTLTVHARLVPVPGTRTAGSFTGLLVKSAASARPRSPSSPPWRLLWKLRLPELGSPGRASLRIPALDGQQRSARVLCRGCTSTASGRLALTDGQALRIAQSRATVVVRMPTALLRGVLKAQAKLPRPTG